MIQVNRINFFMYVLCLVYMFHVFPLRRTKQFLWSTSMYKGCFRDTEVLMKYILMPFNQFTYTCIFNKNIFI